VLLLLVLYLLFALVIMPASLRGAGESLDTRFWYTPQEAYRLLGSGDASSRLASVRSHLTADLLYPLVYGSLLSALLSALTGSRGESSSLLSLLPLLPWAVVVADLLENVSVVVPSLAYPVHLDVLARLSGLFTAAKWAGVVLCLALIVGGGANLAVRWIHSAA
jgi:hypothetical protein